MKTILDKSVRDGMPLSHKLMLACLAIFALSHFLPYAGAVDFAGNVYLQGNTRMVYVGGPVYVPPGTGWELNPFAWVSILVAFAIYAGSPDESIPLFRSVGWWLTPIVLLVFSSTASEAIGILIGLGSLVGMLIAAALHLLEQITARKKAAGDVPPAAPKV